ncbi:uncharacterized protein LOC129600798 [Paramacrobiotus metropolitanus]|uniref:uncharacterized protein LOC129600798 n=1 Tax=Paramacrobiotus metropolitanus TaxID=2943436 RepID=UPI00244638B4|nr:uncharacterized protein LOC129600798 [Paramacrobiotus metropolitanus]
MRVPWKYIDANTCLSLILQIFIGLADLPGSPSLVCSRCQFSEDPNKCVMRENDETETCKPTVKTCMVETKMVMDNSKRPAVYTRAMNRQCSAEEDADKDHFIWSWYYRGNDPTICLNITKVNPSVSGMDIDRRCICSARDGCNYQHWEYVIGHYVFKKVPEYPPNGTNGTTTRPYQPATAAPDPDSQSWADGGLWYNPPSANLPGSEYAIHAVVQAVPSEEPVNSTAPGNPQSTTTDSSGSKTGLIVGLVLGLLIVAGATVGGLWYWFKVRQRRHGHTKTGKRQRGTPTRGS